MKAFSRAQRTKVGRDEERVRDEGASFGWRGENEDDRVSSVGSQSRRRRSKTLGIPREVFAWKKVLRERKREGEGERKRRCVSGERKQSKRGPRNGFGGLEQRHGRGH